MIHSGQRFELEPYLIISNISGDCVPARLPILVLLGALGNDAFHEEQLRLQRRAKTARMVSLASSRVRRKWEFFRGSEYDLVLCEVLHVQHVDLIQMS